MNSMNCRRRSVSAEELASVDRYLEITPESQGSPDLPAATEEAGSRRVVRFRALGSSGRLGVALGVVRSLACARRNAKGGA